jgi:RNA recognition motif-containing protein
MKIYVGNLNQETTEPQIRESFEKFGEVTSLNLITDKESGKPKGFAFVEMSSNEHAEKAITGLNGHEMAGNPWKVNVAKEAKA